MMDFLQWIMSWAIFYSFVAQCRIQKRKNISFATETHTHIVHKSKQPIIIKSPSAPPLTLTPYHTTAQFLGLISFFNFQNMAQDIATLPTGGLIVEGDHMHAEQGFLGLVYQARVGGRGHYVSHFRVCFGQVCGEVHFFPPEFLLGFDSRKTEVRAQSGAFHEIQSTIQSKSTDTNRTLVDETGMIFLGILLNTELATICSYSCPLSHRCFHPNKTGSRDVAIPSTKASPYEDGCSSWDRIICGLTKIKLRIAPAKIIFILYSNTPKSATLSSSKHTTIQDNSSILGSYQALLRVLVKILANQSPKSIMTVQEQKSEQIIKILLIIILNNRNMASSTESKLKSKYDSSSKKIQELYDQFSAMRKHIFTPSKKNKNDESFHGTGDKYERDSLKNSIQVSIPRGPRYREYAKTEALASLNFQTQVLLRNAILKNFTAFFMELDKRVDQRICLMESRLVNLNKLFIQLSNFYRLKYQNLKRTKPTFQCKCVQLQQLMKQVQGKYSKKVTDLIASYEHKISLLVKEHQETSDSSNSKNIPKEVKDQLQRLEDRLIVKEQEINGLKIQGSRVRRVLDQHKVLITEKQALIQQLTAEISEKQNKIIQLAKNKINKNGGSQDKKCQECDPLKAQIAGLNQKIDKMHIQNIQLEKTIFSLRKQLQQSKLLDPKIKTSQRQKSQWNESEIQNQQIVVSDCEDDHQMVSDLKMQNIEDFQPLRHTQYFNTNTRKGSYKYEQKIKQLESQLQLVVEQNKLLKSKKDKFEQQCKDNESDEQKFQMQCQILRDQLKNVNVNLRILDECAVLCLKEKKVPEESVEKLTDVVKFKEEYFRKYPKKRSSQQKSVKL